MLGFGPRGYLFRDYDEEVILSASMKYVFQGEPDSFTDQLILGVEATYTKDRNFTHRLTQEKIVEDEYSTVVSLEKYPSFHPSSRRLIWLLSGCTSRSDMFGRHLSGNGSDSNVGGVPPAMISSMLLIRRTAAIPSLIRADLSILYDLEGGILAQPGVKWRPRDDFVGSLCQYSRQ